MPQTPAVDLRTPSTSRHVHHRPPVDVEVLIPSCNEESRLAGTLQALTAHLAALPFTSAVVVVENGCIDRTSDLVRRAAAGSSVPVHLLGCAEPGKGAAVRRGVLTSSARIVGFQDADLATPLDALAPALAAIAAGADIAVASRRCPGARVSGAQGPVRRLGGNAFSWLCSQVVPELHDTQCGFKFFRAETTTDLFRDQTVTGFAFDVELLARARARGLEVAEIPVVWTSQDGSTFSMSRHGRRAFYDLFRLWQASAAGTLA